MITNYRKSTLRRRLEYFTGLTFDNDLTEPNLDIHLVITDGYMNIPTLNAEETWVLNDDYKNLKIYSRGKYIDTIFNDDIKCIFHSKLIPNAKFDVKELFN